MSLMRFLIFFSVVFTIVGGSHAFLVWRFSRGAPPAWRGRIRALALVNVALIIGAQAGGRFLPDGAFSMTLSTVGYVCMGLFSLVFTAMLFLEIFRLPVNAVDWLAARTGRTPPSAAAVPDPSRRRALAGMVNIGALTLSGGASGVAFASARQPVEVKAVEIPIEGLPEALDGFRIAQITDVHIGATIKGDFLQEVVAQVNALKPDMVALTGDLVDGSVAELGKHTAHLVDLKSRHGTFFVTGNHEYYSGVDEWLDELERLGLKTLNNAHTLLKHDGGRLLLGGVTDLSAGRMKPEHTTSPMAAIEGAPDADLRLLLAHQPGSVFEAERAGFDVQLSGHTHGGQYFPGTIFIHLAHPVVKGLEKVGKVWVYVSCGTGYWGPPFRLGTTAEITDITLRRA